MSRVVLTCGQCATPSTVWIGPDVDERRAAVMMDPRVARRIMPKRCPECGHWVSVQSGASVEVVNLPKIFKPYEPWKVDEVARATLYTQQINKPKHKPSRLHRKPDPTDTLLIFLAVAFLVAVLRGLVVMFGWNWFLAPLVPSLPQSIDLWHAVGLNIFLSLWAYVPDKPEGEPVTDGLYRVLVRTMWGVPAFFVVALPIHWILS